MFIVGKITGVHGLKGELKVKADSSFNRLYKNSIIYIKNNNEYIPYKISSQRIHKNNDLITINDLDDINLVLTFVGENIYALHDNKELSDGEYYYEDLIGKRIISTDKKEIGIVIDLREVPQGILLEVKHQEKIILIPFVEAFIKNINDETIEVEIIEGLL